jgi:hypothetical protein
LKQLALQAEKRAPVEKIGADRNLTKKEKKKKRAPVEIILLSLFTFLFSSSSSLTFSYANHIFFHCQYTQASLGSQPQIAAHSEHRIEQ